MSYLSQKFKTNLFIKSGVFLVTLSATALPIDHPTKLHFDIFKSFKMLITISAFSSTSHRSQLASDFPWFLRSIATKEFFYSYLGKILNQLPSESEPQLCKKTIGVVPST